MRGDDITPQPPTDMETYHISAAIIHQQNQQTQQDEILLVEQQARHDPHPNWTIPGGRIEDGELVYEGLRREVREETGIIVQVIGPLAYLTNAHNVAHNEMLIAHIFEVVAWSGTIAINDPDDHIISAGFYSIADVLERLVTVPWQPMREPLMAYLRGEKPRGAVWCYRCIQPDPNSALLTCSLEF